MDRHVTVRAADPSHVVPYPGRAHALAAAGEPVDRFDGYWAMAIADGSVVVVAVPESPAAAAAPPVAPAAAPHVAVGALVQWTSNGADMFATPERVARISEDGSHAWIEGSDTGLPVSELHVVSGGA